MLQKKIKRAPLQIFQKHTSLQKYYNSKFL